MNLHVLPLGRVARRTEAARRGRASHGRVMAEVYELDAIRRSRMRAIPEDVLAEVDAAACLYDELQADGRHLRFDLHDISGRVVVELCDLDGKVLRPVSLIGAVAGAPEPDAAA